MLTHSLLLSGAAAVKSFVQQRMSEVLEIFWTFLHQTDLRVAEKRCRSMGDAFACLMLHAVVAGNARDAALAQIEAAGLGPKDVRFRNDQDYRVKLSSTLGPVDVPGFAWRDERHEPASTLRAGIDAVHPLRGRCRSTPYLLEWECRFAQQMTFRLAADELLWATSGLADIEDSRMAAHVVAIGARVDRSFMYRTPEDIREILNNRATRQRGSRPIVYVSTDATALRRYVDDSTLGLWRMSNGTRIWCVDRFTNEAIHIGGEYTWNDCHAVVAALTELDRLSILPKDGDYGEGCRATICVVSDGSSWIRDRFQAWFSAPVAVLDVWHLVERLIQDGKTMLGAESPAMRRFSAAVSEAVFGSQCGRTTKEPKPRKGRKNRKRREPKPLPAGPSPARDEANGLIALVSQLKVKSGTEAVMETLLAFLTDNAERVAYRRLRWLGFCIGSGAMESLHRTAVQCRVKMPGAVWTVAASTAIFNLRMMKLAGRWNDFWTSANLPNLLSAAFPPHTTAAPLGVRRAAS